MCIAFGVLRGFGGGFQNLTSFKEPSSILASYFVIILYSGL
jgi:predicted transporter